MTLPPQSGHHHHHPQPLRFTLRIGHFSQAVTSGGHFLSQVFRSGPESGHRWSLGARFQEGGATEIRLHHRGGAAGSVRARLTLVDCLGSRMVSCERRVHFRGGSEEGEESRPLLRLGGGQVSGGWCGLKSLCFVPNDTLTLKCEIDESGGDDDYDEGLRNEVVRRCGWRDSYLLSIPATGMPLA